MSVTLKNLVFAVTGAVLVTLTAQAGACDRGGGYRVAYRPQVNYHCQNVYQRPIVQQPINPQLQPWMQPGFAGQNPGVNVTIQGQQQLGGGVSAVSALGGGAPAQGFQQQQSGGFQQPQQNVGFQPQQSGGFQPQNTLPQNTVQPQQLGGAAAPGNGAPQSLALQQPGAANSTPAAAPAQSAQSAQKNAQSLALEALMGLGGEQAAATQTPAPAAVSTTGDFTAKVASGATVRLSLNADGSFVWTAAKDGKSSNFQGSFTLAGSSLTLLRSDNQKLEGLLTPSPSGFQLRLSGQTDNGLNFIRS